MLNYKGSCKRIDLIFRAKYPYYVTELYKISDLEYQIFLNEEVDDFLSLEKEYDNSIRFITSPVQLVNKRPSRFIEKVDPIDDSILGANYEGLPFTRFQLINHIECLYPNVLVSKIDTDHDKKVIHYSVNDEMYSGSIDELRETLMEASSPYDYRLKFSQEKKEPAKPTNIFEVVASSTLKNFDPGYLERDERLWFDNASNIYSGGFSKKDLFFFDEQTSKCLLDFSVFSNVNLRNHLLLYDEVFCILPLTEKMNDFLEKQKLSKDDLLYLIEQGRLKIVNTQPEFRLDHAFLKECYQTKSESVISRRALAALSAIDIVETQKNYIFKDIDFIRDIDPLLSNLSTECGQKPDFLKRILTWPTSALRNSFDALNSTATKSIPSFGVNQTITSHMSEETKKRCELEFLSSSEAIHISHSLDATYYPFFEESSGFSDQQIAILMANSLNFYKLSNMQYLGEEQSMFNPELTRNISVELLSVFDVNDYISISEYLNEIENPLSRKCLNRLFTELSSLPREERDVRIREYNEQVEKALRGKAVARNAVDLSVDGAGLFVPFISTGIKAAGWLGAKAQKKYPLLQEISNYISDKAHSSNVLKRELHGRS